MPSNHLIHCYSLLLLPSVFSNIGVFSNESALCIRLPKYRSFSFNISLSNVWIFRMVSFRFDWFDLLAVQRTLKSLLQHHSLKMSILRHSVFFMVQLSHPFTGIGKTIAVLIYITTFFCPLYDSIFLNPFPQINQLLILTYYLRLSDIKIHEIRKLSTRFSTHSIHCQTNLQSLRDILAQLVEQGLMLCLRVENHE